MVRMIKNGVTVFRNEGEVEAAKAQGFSIVEEPKAPAEKKQDKKPEGKQEDKPGK